VEWCEGWRTRLIEVETRRIQTGTAPAGPHCRDIIELRVWPPMAGLHSAGGGLLADSGGSGCATAWHRHLLQPKAGAIPFSYRAGLAATVVEGRLRTRRLTVHQKSRLLRAYELDSPCGNRAMRAGGCRGCARPCIMCMAGVVGEISESFGAWLMLLSSAWEPRTRLWHGERICSVFRMNPVHADHLRAHSASYAAGGFAEAKGKYRGSIVESLAVLPIGCCVAKNPDDDVRVAGVVGSFRCAEGVHMYVCMHLVYVCMYVCTVLCPPTGHGSRTTRQHSVALLPVCTAGGGL
jgi:hypothetical protein